MAFPMPTVRLAIFEGPLDVLLRLIQEQKLDITELSLVAVTKQFLEHVQSTQEQDGPLLAGIPACSCPFDVWQVPGSTARAAGLD